MPIYKDSKLILKFGSGDIIISCASDEPVGDAEYIIIYECQTPYPINKPIPELAGKPIDNWAIKMFFNDSESIDSIISVLEEFRTIKFPSHPVSIRL